MALRAPLDTRIEGATLSVYKSSGFAERGFCMRCGSHIFHRPQDGPELAVSAGLFASDDLRLDREIFHDRKPEFYAFQGATRKRSSTVMALAWAPRMIWRRLRRQVGARG